ncbi:hypothetical protein F8O01_01980 [Pseudoclavibacter chungangensis]|uniref:Uncharacterized protein n=1 Tax=Pseudoclavibacter chungangensis TaxID=587635 RepID=A0A7J5C1A8_9MICO|nr:hypothetical protein [Pseudoclavibacter chungangensis]KAB1662251.1 hypothetical protein F8O01_01980 [Pseudoclavibacter chungangensis]NYJ65456.1 hypothetical protein [Pseudoclavibacter chungangensis]
MNEDRTGTPHWDVVPSPELEQKASSWLRGMIRFIIESTDDPDTTPDRFERTLGITFLPTENDLWHLRDESNSNYDCWANVAPDPDRFAGADLTLDRSDRSRRDVRALVRDPDAAWVETELSRAGFTLHPIYPAHEGKPIAMRFARGRISGNYGLAGSGRLGNDVSYVTKVVMRWSDPYTT